MNLKNGEIQINGELFSSGYTFEVFKKSEFYDNQDGIRIINLNGIHCIGNNNFVVSLFFRNYVLYMISMICIDVNISFEDELKRKQLHDDILKKYGVESPAIFDWGNIKSVYDPKGNVSSINIVYNI